MFNICAETSSGDPQKTVVVGAHFDSVPAGMHTIYSHAHKHFKRSQWPNKLR